MIWESMREYDGRVSYFADEGKFHCLVQALRKGGFEWTVTKRTLSRFGVGHGVTSGVADAQRLCAAIVRNGGRCG